MSLVAEHSNYLKFGGLFELPKKILRLSGPDSADFLHRLTTQDVKNLRPGFGVPAALLQSDAKIISFFDLYHCGNYFLLVIDQNLFQATWDSLEKFHFAENLEIQKEDDRLRFVSVQGTSSEQALKKVLGRLPESENDVIGTENCFITRRDEIVGKGYNLLIKTGQWDRLLQQLKSENLNLLSLDLWNLLRAEAGHFKFGVDINEKNLVLESALDGYVSRNKGCYPGQEVVERVFTYGNVAKKLVGLEWLSSQDPTDKTSQPLKLFSEGQEVGRITSVTTLPWNQKMLGLGLVRKPFYEEGQLLSVENQPQSSVKVVRLPHSFDIKRELA